MWVYSSTNPRPTVDLERQVGDLDLGQELYDSTAAWRERTMAGTFHSGAFVSGGHSDDRTFWQ